MCASLTDTQWARIEPLPPDPTPRRGGQWRDHRQVIGAIAFKYRTGCRGWICLSASARGRAPTTAAEVDRRRHMGEGLHRPAPSSSGRPGDSSRAA
ncbi:transposase [Kitasatospora xanthocidica]|uniref:Transposase n=1 Tax=Kitasatospora xanthocidica TaxID=83382 RepID=A0A372ZRD6_9ACTN|nr:transposase [Kitasatospora xanthocidica]